MKCRWRRYNAGIKTATVYWPYVKAHRFRYRLIPVLLILGK